MNLDDLQKKIYEVVGEPLSKQQINDIMLLIFESEEPSIERLKIEVATFFAGRKCTVHSSDKIEIDDIKIYVSKDAYNEFIKFIMNYINNKPETDEKT